MPLAASCSPMYDELVSTIWPSSSSVPIATTSQRTGQATWVNCAWRAALRARHRYWPPLMRASATEIHSRPFHSQVASSAVSGAIAKPTDNCWVNVFHLAILLAGTLTPDPSLRYFANSDFTAERWRALCGIDCCVIPPIIDAERYLVAQTGKQVLFVNPTPIKGVEILFALAAACPELPFLVYESWNLAPAWREHCQQRARALGNVRWQAPTLDMRQAYAQARVLLMPSIWEESFGRTVIEAQLNGLPVLASHRGALPALVGQGGLTLEAHAPIADWAQALRHLYAQPDAAGAAGREQAMRHVAATPLRVGQLLGELAIHAAAHRTDA